MAEQPKTWFITGAARGFGLEIARAALDRGHRVVATARHAAQIAEQLPGAGGRLLALDLDVTDEEGTRRAVREAVDAFGRIDVVVNNAGRGTLGAVEEVPDEAVRSLFAVNVFGTLNVLRAVLPVLRAQRSGHVINMSSVGGLAATPGWGLYNATKFAVEGLSESLVTELAPLGIRVTLIEPGYFRTDFLDTQSLATAEVIDDYDATAGATRRYSAEVNHGQPGDPVKAAAAIVEITEADPPPLRLLLGTDSVDRVEAKVERLLGDIDRFRELSLSTDHDDVRAG
ncbi:NADP-dependent 3-hydroxy acid dehydrogenase YdfG [Streptomyces sp. DvalAA-14]|uniref:oxidoreductase n=1 Tax=unclassified Streptomyces TaxID=2593676 RepID=UPI00081B4C34|nr:MULTISPECIES: oxidoreductase [unclassified Streptomyces]MYS21976.1 SDR family NAD(P)-dependent oxidoreductase [Streptomyces sp. SID4948]SCE05754.1 NADP-dependent 3-hydroxy acid dehydrogenase YdfG [Streptomyces sp. DvalAA-14]